MGSMLLAAVAVLAIHGARPTVVAAAVPFLAVEMALLPKAPDL